VFLTTFDTNRDIATNLDPYVKTGFRDFIMHGLSVMNRMYRADFDMTKFKFECRWNEEEKSADHCVVSQSQQKVTADNKIYTFEEGEALRILFGKKRSVEDFEKLAAEAGGVVKRPFYDKQGFLCMVWIEKA